MSAKRNGNPSYDACALENIVIIDALLFDIDNLECRRWASMQIILLLDLVVK